MPECPTCGSKVPYKISVPKTRPVFSLPKKDDRTIQSVDIPRKHGLDFGIALGIFGGCLTGLIGGSKVQSYLAGGATFAVVFVIVRAISTVKDWKLFVWKAEEMTGIDFTDDDIIGEPRTYTPSTPASDVWVPWKKKGRKAPRWKRYIIPWSNKREAQMVARSVVKWGKPFSRRVLTDMNVLPDDPEHYTRIYQAMIKDGLLIKGNTAPTEKGIEYLKGCLLPPPQD